MTAWLWLFGTMLALGVVVTASEVVSARRADPVPDAGDPVREAAAEYLRGLAPAGTPSLAEAAVLARLNPRADRERLDAAIRLLELDVTGDD